MRRFLLITFFSITFFEVVSQDLVNGRSSSYHTFIYKITNDEAEKFYDRDAISADVKHLHTLFDFFPTDSGYTQRLPTGHFLFIKSVGNRLEIELRSENNLDMIILNNDRDLSFSFYDGRGEEVKNLKPRVGRGMVRFDLKTNVYRKEKTNKQGLVKVEHDGHLNLFKIHREYNNTLPMRFARGVTGTFPINHLISPVVYVVKSLHSLIAYQYVSPPGIFYRIRSAFASKYYDGYMVTNKPMYKPGDTVRLKAFVTTKKGKPITKNLDLVLSGRSPYIERRLGKISPYADGAYAFEFVLHDSLGLRLDKEFRLDLEDRRGNHFPSAVFSFEQYELKQNSFTLQPVPANTLHKPASILLKGTDSNDLPLYDVKASILVQALSVSDFYEKTMFVPDVLWTHDQKLDPLGETKITLPDSIYPRANFSYEVVATFTNAENEQETRKINMSYDSKKKVQLELKNDSVIVALDESKTYRLAIFSSRDALLSNKIISLPFREKVHGYAARYLLYDENNVISTLSTENESHLIEALADRTADSLHVFVQNPHKLIFQYQLFKNNRIIEQGSSNSFSIRLRTKPNDNYYLALQTVWAGEPRRLNYDFPFAKKPLQITVDHPTTVFPGQAAEMTIDVKDAFGKPVQDADLTAYATTKKFRKVETAAVPSYEKFTSRKAFNKFSQSEVRELEMTRTLQYDYWKSRLGLDSITYYDFVYPGNKLFINYSSTHDSITQVAPFIFSRGEQLAPIYIYSNGELKYFHQTQNVEPYSFRVNDKLRKLTIRLKDQLIVIKNVPVQHGKKLILSLDINNLPDSVQSIKQSTKLTSEEMWKLRPHFLSVNRITGQSKAYLQQGDNYRLLRQRESYFYDYELVGPFFPGTVKYYSTFDVSFPFRASMVYTFSQNLVDREKVPLQFAKYLPRYSNNQFSISDRVQTKESIEAFWKSQEKSLALRLRKYPDSQPVGENLGRLAIKDRNQTTDKKRLATFLLNLDKPDEFYIFPATTNDFGQLYPGLYQCIVVYEDQSYCKPKPVHVKANGRTFYSVADDAILPPDAFSNEVMEKINQWATESVYVDKIRRQEMDEIRQLYYSPYDGPGRTVSGRVTSTEDGSPLPGVNVVVKGTVNGTATDLDGYYRLTVPFGGELIFSFIGLESREFQVGQQSMIDVSLAMDVQQLNEVVVTAGGLTVQRRALGNQATGIRAMSGKVGGLIVSGNARDRLVLRGRRTGDAEKALVVIDGVLKRYDEIDEEKIAAIEILNAEQATALYGARASNGVILISTKPGTTREQLLNSKLPEAPQFISLDKSTPGSSIRKNFRDYAFWQPKLRTDENGVAKFTANYPDDITGWNVHVLGIASKRRSGEARTQVQSFKPLLAQFYQPNFLLAGDTASAIRKVTNYTADSVLILSSVKINGATIQTEKQFVKNSRIDSVLLIGVGDSLTTQFEIEYNKYRDGEIRKIPVLPVGSKETLGIFAAMPKDTTITAHFNKNSIVTIRAHADLIDVLLDEIKEVKFYPHECNEQLASKLKALLSEKTIRDYKREKFEHDKVIEKLIKKLSVNQAKNGSWSWWGAKGGSYWITVHVVEALDWAEKLKYNVAFDRQHLRDFLMETPAFLSPYEKLKSWIYLSKSGEKVIAKSLTDSLAKKNMLYDNYYKLLAMRLIQLNGEQPDWKWLDTQEHKTLKGNIYWGEDKVSMVNNDVDNSLLAYQLIEHQNPNDARLILIRNFFLEKRNQNWRNTYESSRIIETLLASLQSSVKYQPSVVNMTGDMTLMIDKFPYEKKIVGIENLTIEKSGGSPVYFTAFEEKWNSNPEPVKSDFVITSTLRDNKKLRAGKSFSVKVTLDVKRDAEYVMINIPIPAGCSYENKEQNFSNGEVHREYDLHETRIYCERLKAGIYEYTVKLVPRYKGKYRVNPAKAEWMYFPVKFGRDETSRVEIQ